MWYEAQRLTTRREGYPSGKWKPEAELASSPRLVRPRWNKAFFILLTMTSYATVLIVLVKKNLLTGWGPYILVLGAVVSPVFVAISVAKEVKVLRFGVPAEGQILGIADDGIDRLFTIYYEDNGVPFQAAITAKNHPYARNWRTGDSVTLFLKPRQSGDTQKFLLYPSSLYQVVS